MKTRNERVVKAFINCVKVGKCSYDEAVTAMENEEWYGYLTDEAKEMFYNEFEVEEEVAEESPIESIEA